MATKQREITQMLFIPDEDVHSALVDLFHPLGKERLTRSQGFLAFYSIKGCMAEDRMDDMVLDYLDESLDGDVYASYSGIDIPPASANTLDLSAFRLALHLNANLSGNEDVAAQARQLGFANENSMVIARLVLERGLLHEGDELTEKIVALQMLVDSSMPPRQAVTKLIQRD